SLDFCANTRNRLAWSLFLPKMKDVDKICKKKTLGFQAFLCVDILVIFFPKLMSFNVLIKLFFKVSSTLSELLSILPPLFLQNLARCSGCSPALPYPPSEQE